MQAKKQKKNPTKTMTYNLFSLYVTVTYKVDDTERGGALCVRGSPRHRSLTATSSRCLQIELNVFPSVLTCRAAQSVYLGSLTGAKATQVCLTNPKRATKKYQKAPFSTRSKKYQKVSKARFGAPSAPQDSLIISILYTLYLRVSREKIPKKYQNRDTIKRWWC